MLPATYLLLFALLATLPPAHGGRKLSWDPELSDPEASDMLTRYYRDPILPPYKEPGKAAAVRTSPAWGTYRQRAWAANGDVEIWAYDVVAEEAVSRAATLVGRMLQLTPQHVRDRLRLLRIRLAIIGKDQGLLDLPDYEHLRDDSDKWGEKRGLGAVVGNPVSTCPEENILELDEDPYFSENVCVHEFGHGVMNIGLSGCELRKAVAQYGAAAASGVYNASSYFMKDEFEYFAVASSVWFNATLRGVEVTDLVTTRARLWGRDPDMHQIMMQAYGYGSWQYPDECPRCQAKWPWAKLLEEPRPGTVPYGGDTVCAPTPPGCDANTTMCPFWSSKGYCEPGSEYYLFMQRTCVEACSWCGAAPAQARPPPPYSDPGASGNCYNVKDDYSCNYWAGTGECQKTYAYMRINCRRACGWCGGDGSSGGDSGGAVVGSPPPPPLPGKRGVQRCRDVGAKADCRRLLKRGECSSNTSYMNANCARTCGACST